MMINNPFQMNDWKFGQFIKYVLLIQVLVLAITGLELNNINIPILSQIIPFIYLTFIPGFLILRILRLHKLGNIETILFTVGLSITSIMFIGFVMNFFYPLIGISKPISLLYLVIIISFYVLILCFLSYIMDKNFYNPDFIDINDCLSSKFLFLLLLPFLAIFGSYFVNFYENNIISMFLILLIGLTFILVIFDVIPRKLYSFTIWIMAISLVYMSSLISTYVWGWDIQNEYYLASLVLKFSYWNSNLPDAYNSMLSIVMLSPIYSIITNMNLDWVLKIMYPFLFSLIPLGLYKIFKKQTENSKIAFLAIFLFISFNTFYIEMLSLTREITAELFLISILLLIFNRKFKANLVFLFIIFDVGLIVSHYSTNYFFIAALIGVIVVLTLFKLFSGKISLNKNQIIKIVVIPSVLVFSIILTYLWYLIFSQGAALAGLGGPVSSIKEELFRKIAYLTLKIGLAQDMVIYISLIFLVLIFSMITVYTIKIGQKNHKSKLNWFLSIQDSIRKKINYKIIAVISVIVLVFMVFLTGPLKTWIVSVLRYLNFDVVFFTFVGLVLSILCFDKNKFQKEYLAFSILAAGMLLAGITIPSFEVSFNISRIYELSFIFLAPFCVIGGIKVVGSILKILNKSEINSERSIKIFSVFLLIFLLFNVGFFSVLSGQSIPMHLSGQSSASDYHPRFNYQESLGAQWLSENMINAKIFADVYGVFLFYRYISSPNEISTNNGVYEIATYDDTDSYIFLRKLNKDNNMLVGFTSRTNRNRVYEDMSRIITPKNKIYDDGDSKVFYG